MQTKRILESVICFHLFFYSVLFLQAQKKLPEDYLSKEFHRGRREAARALMPVNSVMVVFAAPTRTFSNDVEYLYHQNPDLYYFTGYKEPNSVLFLFKENQLSVEGEKYNELFFVQKRDALSEQWTGRRLGTEGVKTKLGIQQAFEGDKFGSFPINFAGFTSILLNLPKGITDNNDDKADLHDLLNSFKEKAFLPDSYNESVELNLMEFLQNAEPTNWSSMKEYFVGKATSENHKTDSIYKLILNLKDSTQVNGIKEQIKTRFQNQRFNAALYQKITGQLREIKTSEEMVLLRKAVDISCMGHNEALKAMRPQMSEREVQGIQEFVHKKYGAEEVGYNSIVGSGDNGCVLHYIENNKTRIGNEMIVMDVAAEYHGYTADVTRSVPPNGKFSTEQKAIYQLVYDAQEAAFTKLKDGVKWSEASIAAREVIANGLMKLGITKSKEDNRKYYPHGLSHHIGLDVHDRFYSDTLRKGMVITIEPGIYIPSGSPCDKKWWGIGVRIEDDVLIRENDYELLSNLSPRSIGEIEKLMAEQSVLNNFILPPLPSDKKPF